MALVTPTPASGDLILSSWGALVNGAINPTAWTAVTFVGTWVNFGGGDQVAEYRKVNDVVQLRGRIKSGTLTSVAFTLPAGFRPPANLWFPNQSNGVFGAFYITNAGSVQPYYGSVVDQSVNCQFSVT